MAFTGDITIGDVALERSGDDLLVGVVDDSNSGVSFHGLTDRLTLNDWSNAFERVEILRFSNGSHVDISNLGVALQALGNTPIP